MNKELRPKFKAKEQIVTRYVVDCRRHGEKEEGEEKDKKPRLSVNGEAQGRFVTALKPPYTPGDVYISKIPRTRQTAEAMQETEWEKGKEVLGIGAGKIFETERLGDETFWKSKKFRDSYFKIKEEKGVNAANQWYLNFKKQKPFGEAISPEEAAASYASVILGLADELASGKEKNKIGQLPKTIISHDLVMEPFLYFTIGKQVEKDRDLKGEGFIEKSGGTLEPISGLEIELEKKENKIKALLSFRSKKYELDLNKMKKLVKKYENNWAE
ncbi:histidine phosphatase family protein [Candidatus Woesearchaeota archaeon]|nr:histidine phosphatase family protein [Candidatus Woesearchaeota archaeon]